MTLLNALRDAIFLAIFLPAEASSSCRATASTSPLLHFLVTSQLDKANTPFLLGPQTVQSVSQKRLWISLPEIHTWHGLQ